MKKTTGNYFKESVMRKILLVVIWSLICMTTALAQEQDPWLGTWTSETYRDVDSDAEDFVYTDYRYIIKITKNSEKYLVRAKTIKVSDPSHAIYDDAYGIKQFVDRIEGNSMLIESSRDKIPFYVNGQLDSYSKATSYFRLTLNNGVLHCSLYKYIVESYDKNTRYEYTNTYGLHEKYPGPCVERDLFNDDW